MLAKIGIIILGCLASFVASASKLPTYSQGCVFLGSKPSLIIKFKDISSKQHQSLEMSIIRRFSSNKATFTTAKAMSGDAYIVFFDPKKSLLSKQIMPGCYSKTAIDSLIRELKLKANIIYIDPNILIKLSQLKEASFVPIIGAKQWNLLNPPGGIDAQTAFNTTTGSSNAITAVLDTGSLPNNSLTPNLLSGATFNDNGSFISTGSSPSCDATCVGYEHGTHVSGIVATSGVLAYGESIYGVAPTSKILPINVFTKSTSPIDCGIGNTPCLIGRLADEIDALNWLSGDSFNGLPNAPYITMINMSFAATNSCGDAVQAAINKLLAKNISFAVAAGNGTNNDGIPTDAMNITPANCIGVMPTAATGPAGYGAYYSNYGSIVSFAAPGGDITGGLADTIYSTIENGYGYEQGTSMASPHVAGLGALLYSLDPTLTPAKVLNIIQTTTTPFPSGGPGNSCVAGKPCGTGIINANSAVLAAINQAPVLAWTPNLTITINSATQATIQWQAAAWQPTRTTPIIYTVNNNGVDVTGCQQISSTSCILSNLIPNVTYTVYIKASDVRNIYGPIQSSSKQFTINLTGPKLTVAVRNPLRETQAFIYFSSLDVFQPNSYTINGTPAGATLTLNTNEGRFVISNITTPKRIDNVTVTATYSSTNIQSNSVSIPSIL